MSDLIAIQIVLDLSFVGSKNLVRQNGGPPMIYSEEKETQKNKIQNNRFSLATCYNFRHGSNVFDKIHINVLYCMRIKAKSFEYKVVEHVMEQSRQLT